MEDFIDSYLEQFDLDIRKSRDARFFDQKCTPDVVCFISDCIMNMRSTFTSFTIYDLWNTQYFVQNCRVLFGKPWANDETARHEYDKLIAQPLKMLAYAHILNVAKVGRQLNFTIENEPILDFIARKEPNAYIFLCKYLKKVMDDTDFYKNLTDYKNTYLNDTPAAKETLYDKFYRLIHGNTPIQTRVEANRIFHKIFNVYAVYHHLPGSNGKTKYYSDLMYNNVNWRDINKDKNETRQQYENAHRQEIEEKNKETISAYHINKACSLVRKIQDGSEVKDKWGMGEATQAHHIFPKSQFPQIADYIENIILLTAQQHFSKAHPHNSTSLINRDYQLDCLLAKLDTIEKSIEQKHENYYSKEDFIEVINTGLDTNLSPQLSYEDIRIKLRELYHNI